MSQIFEVRNSIRKLSQNANHFSEFRFHSKKSRGIGVRKGIVSDMSAKQVEGLGVRVLYNGTWGFAATSELSAAAIEKCMRTAEQMAMALDRRKKKKISLPSTKRLAKGEYLVKGVDELEAMPVRSKFEFVKSAEERLRKSTKHIEAASCQYNEVFEEKLIVTSDGADCHLRWVRPELRFVAFGSDGTHKTMGFDSVGGTGGWECLFYNRDVDQFIENAASSAIHLLTAKPAEGGVMPVILSPAMVGLLSHEAIGHTVEADFVKSGSVAKDRLGQMVASDLVSLCDSGDSEYHQGAGGVLPVDDEGVVTQKTYIIRKGKLESYLHNRESAAEFGVEPTGNARAWEFGDEPLIRMRNTYIEPGLSNIQELISGIENGYYVDGPEGGQADATGEFMFGANKVRKIVNGKLGDHVQNVTVSGNAFEVLKSVDGVSKDFKWDLGSGHCGKGQPAKVDAGGPYLRCKILVGGVQK